ncbi:MAG: PLDc N-terminal domain-containing protein [Desulfobulbaceae bacterium]|nr:PLDc N-terminal domain-containing protein [Desulfobulbaceae bacterium]
MNHWFESHFAIVIGVLLAVAAIGHMLQQRRAPSSTVAWLLIMVLLPYIGIPLYILLGGRKMARIAQSKRPVYLNESDILPLSEASSIDRGLRSLHVPAAMLGNSMQLCNSGAEAYDCLVKLIEKAEKSLFISTYVFADDEVGRDILSRLVRKASRGVTVRLLLDGVGSLKTGSTFFKPLAEAGGRFAYFMPVLHHPLRGRTNLRNHRKIALSDGRFLMAGGTNIANEYLLDSQSHTDLPCYPNNPKGVNAFRQRAHNLLLKRHFLSCKPYNVGWKDLSCAVEGPAVRPFVELFLSDWLFASGEKLEMDDSDGGGTIDACGQAVLQVVPSGPDLHHDGLYEAILSAIFQARKKLWIVTPYFVPDDALAQGLIIACRRGVDVRVVVPEKSNHPLADIVRGNYLREIREAGARIMLYRPGMLHAKLMVVDDDMAMIGSANMDLRSLFINYEVAVFVYSHREVETMVRWADSLFSDTLVDSHRAGTGRKLIEGIVRIVAPLV